MTSEHRQPQAFVIPPEDKDDKPRHPVHTKQATRKSRSAAPAEIEMIEEPLDGDNRTVPVSVSLPGPTRIKWGTILICALATLFTMGAGLSILQLVESYFARSQWLGWLTAGLAGLALLALLAIIMREIWGLVRLHELETIQDLAARGINLEDKHAAESALQHLKVLYKNVPDASWALQELDRHRSDIMDSPDRLRLAERILVEPRDLAARKIIAKRARRVTVLTTVTPAAALDIAFVATQNLSMLRELASLYGGRPSTLSTLRLARMVATHLAITGGIALSDTLIQQVVGKGLLGRLSARLGEGAVNGILTTRIGLAAARVCRPIPRKSDDRETLAGMTRELLSFGEETKPPT